MNTRVKKLIWIILGIGITGFIINSYLINNAIKDAKRIDYIRKTNAIKSSINDLVSFNKAVDNWEELLGKGEVYRFEPIMTLELEELWLQNRPILFIGAIKDIATYNEDHYTLIVERESFDTFDNIYDTQLQLSLSSPKSKIDNLLKSHPDIFKDNGINNSIAVIASVKHIQSINTSIDETLEQDVKRGVGELIDILYLGNISL